MDLKVVAKRKEGFTAPIAVSLLWNPPGIGSAGGVVDPREAERGRHPAQRRRRRRAEDLEDRRQRLVDRAERADHRLVAAGQAERRRAVLELHVPGRERRAGQGGRPVRSRWPRRSTSRARRQVTLVGLPNKVTTDVKTITKDTTDLVFRVKTDAASPAGNHANLFCQVVVTQNGEPIVHNLGTGALRIDVPLPPKPNAPPMPVAVAAAPAARRAAAAPVKPLTRLEKLRLENQERAKAACRRRPPRPSEPSARHASPWIEEGTAVRLRPRPQDPRAFEVAMTVRPFARKLVAALAAFGLAGHASAQQAALTKLEAFPPDIKLSTARDRQSVVVQATFADGITRDVTKEAVMTPANPALVRRDGDDLPPGRRRRDELDGRLRRPGGHGPGQGRAGRGPAADQLPARRDAGLHEGRLQHRQLPRRRPRQGRVPALALRLRPRGRPLPPDPRDERPAGQPGRPRRQHLHREGHRRRPRTPAASGSSRRASSYQTLHRWIEAGAPNDDVDQAPHRRRASTSTPSRPCSTARGRPSR